MATTTLGSTSPMQTLTAGNSAADVTETPGASARRRKFRQHHEPPVLNNRLLSELCTEWVRLNAEVDACSRVRSWGTHSPALSGFDSPGALVDAIDHASPALADEMAQALLARVRTGDQMAGRVLLQVMLPCLSNLVWSSSWARGADRDEQLQRTVSEFWFVIGRPTSLPPRRVLARLQLDTLHRISSHQRGSDAWEKHTSYVDDVDDTYLDDESGCAGRIAALGRRSTTTSQPHLHLVPNDGSGRGYAYDQDAGLLQLLVTACIDGRLKLAEAQFLADVYLRGTPGETTLSAAAQRLDLSHASVRQRCTRLKSKLRETVLVDRATHGDAEPLPQAS